MTALLLALTAHAASLDLLEVGGAWGTPAGTNASAVWWNPAALSFEPGTRFLVEGAPIVAFVNIDRDEPAYGWTAPASCADDPSPAFCQRPVYGGLDRIRFTGVAPFAGIATDFGVPGLGVGAALFVPHARGGHEVEQPGTGRTHLREANVQAIYGSLGVSYAWRQLFGVGAAVSYIDATWYARIDNQTATSFRDFPGVGALLASELDGASVEDPSLLVDTTFGPLKDRKVSFQAGIYARPHPSVSISVGYAYGARVDHAGDVRLKFACPDPAQYPLLGNENLGAPRFGVCDADMSGRSTVGYRYPMRVNVGVAWTPTPATRLEALGGWVGWSAYTDFEISVQDVESKNTEITPETAALLAIERKWARDNRDSFYVGVDAKTVVYDRVTLGGRFTFDHAAVPDAVMSQNNADFDTFLLGALVAVKPSKHVPVQLGLSYTANLAVPRTITTSAFRVDVEPDDRVEDRFMYPEMNGRYSSQIHRVGISIKGDFKTGVWRRLGETAER